MNTISKKCQGMNNSLATTCWKVDISRLNLLLKHKKFTYGNQ